MTSTINIYTKYDVWSCQQQESSLISTFSNITCYVNRFTQLYT